MRIWMSRFFRTGTQSCYTIHTARATGTELHTPGWRIAHWAPQLCRLRLSHAFVLVPYH